MAVVCEVSENYTRQEQFWESIPFLHRSLIVWEVPVVSKVCYPNNVLCIALVSYEPIVCFHVTSLKSMIARSFRVLSPLGNLPTCSCELDSVGTASCQWQVNVILSHRNHLPIENSQPCVCWVQRKPRKRQRITRQYWKMLICGAWGTLKLYEIWSDFTIKIIFR